MPSHVHSSLRMHGPGDRALGVTGGLGAGLWVTGVPSVADVDSGSQAPMGPGGRDPRTVQFSWEPEAAPRTGLGRNGTGSTGAWCRAARTQADGKGIWLHPGGRPGQPAVGPAFPFLRQGRCAGCGGSPGGGPFPPFGRETKFLARTALVGGRAGGRSRPGRPQLPFLSPLPGTVGLWGGWPHPARALQTQAPLNRCPLEKYILLRSQVKLVALQPARSSRQA